MLVLAFLGAVALLVWFWFGVVMHEPLEANIRRREELDAINKSMSRFAAGDYIITTGELGTCYKVHSVSLGTYQKRRFSERIDVINDPSMYVDRIAINVGSSWAIPNEKKFIDLICYQERHSPGGKSHIYLFCIYGTGGPVPDFNSLRKVDQNELMMILDEAKRYEEQRIEREHRKRLEEEAKKKAFIAIQQDKVNDMLEEIEKLKMQ